MSQSMSFDAVSVKPVAQRARASHVTMDPSRFAASAISLHDLILVAFGLDRFQLSGGPAWIDSDLFAVEATTSRQTSPSEMKAMLQAMLAERFGLKMDSADKPMKVFELRGANNGVRLRRAGDPEPKITTSQNFNLVATSLPGFAKFLTDQNLLGAPVVDRTGLDGDYLIGLVLNVLPESQPGVISFDWPTGHGFIAMLERQLGLTAAEHQGIFKIYTIERSERPRGNE